MNCPHRFFQPRRPVLRTTRPDPSVDFAAFESFSLAAARVLAGEGNTIDEVFVREYIGRQGRRAYYPGAVSVKAFSCLN